MGEEERNGDNEYTQLSRNLALEQEREKVQRVGWIVRLKDGAGLSMFKC